MFIRYEGGMVMNSCRWIDVHAHIDMLEDDWLSLKKELLQSGVERVINIGTNPEDNPKVLKVAQEHHPLVYCTLGMHPHEAKLYDQNFEDFLKDNLDKKEVVAVGEIGLDYYYEHSRPEVQKEVFRKQLKIACHKGLPVEVHTRDAEEDTISILKEFKGHAKGLIHCFTGSQFLADQALALGFNISFSGVVTFKNAESLRDVCRKIPLERIHVETDSPFLAPVPHRGKPNRPSLVVAVAQKVAELKGVSLEELSCQVRKNALKLFDKMEWDL